MRRIFVVGCPRSGTTLVQAMLARHRSVFSLRETCFFETLLGDLSVRWADREARSSRKWYHRAGLAQSWGRRHLRELECSQSVWRRWPAPRRWRACVGRYARLLDEVSAREGCSAWVEKTPYHLLYLDEIGQCIPGARVVHVLRRGIDVVASIVDADLRLRMRAFRGGVAQWAHRWNHAMELHLGCVGNPGHYLLCLEDLLENPEREWRSLRDFAGLDVGVPLDPHPHNVVVDPSREPWMANGMTGVVHRPESKAHALFGPRTLAWLQAHLADYGTIREAVRHSREKVARLPAYRRAIGGQRSAAGA